jgi:hypothetical protein
VMRCGGCAKLTLVADVAFADFACEMDCTLAKGVTMETQRSADTNRVRRSAFTGYPLVNEALERGLVVVGSAGASVASPGITWP